MPSLSPFSPRCNYQISEFAWQNRNGLHLSPRDQILVSRICMAGAASFFQICDKKRDRLKLKALGRAGVLNLYRLEGLYRMNVASWNRLNLDAMLRTLVLTQFLLISGAVFDGRQVHINGVPWDLFVVRYGDNAPWQKMQESIRSLVLAEEYCAGIDVLPSTARILLDEDLIINRLHFITPGTFPAF